MFNLSFLVANVFGIHLLRFKLSLKWKTLDDNDVDRSPTESYIYKYIYWLQAFSKVRSDFPFFLFTFFRSSWFIESLNVKLLIMRPELFKRKREVTAHLLSLWLPYWKRFGYRSVSLVTEHFLSHHLSRGHY